MEEKRENREGEGERKRGRERERGMERRGKAGRLRLAQE